MGRRPRPEHLRGRHALASTRRLNEGAGRRAGPFQALGALEGGGGHQRREFRRCSPNGQIPTWIQGRAAAGARLRPRPHKLGRGSRLAGPPWLGPARGRVAGAANPSWKPSLRQDGDREQYGDSQAWQHGAVWSSDWQATTIGLLQGQLLALGGESFSSEATRALDSFALSLTGRSR